MSHDKTIAHLKNVPKKFKESYVTILLQFFFKNPLNKHSVNVWSVHKERSHLNICIIILIIIHFFSDKEKLLDRESHGKSKLSSFFKSETKSKGKTMKILNESQKEEETE